jgi:glucose/arabinose dehydrogenase
MKELPRMLALLGCILWVVPCAGQQFGRAAPVPVGGYLNGVFPAATPGLEGDWMTVRSFPNLTFTDPMWLTPWPGSEDLLMVERTGRLKRFANDQDAVQADVSVVLDWTGRTQTRGDEGGMYSAVFHPLFANPDSPRRFLYLCYTHQLEEGVNHPDGSSYWRLTRIEFDEFGGVIPGSETILISLFDPHAWHNGGAMFFGPDGFLYLSNGDGGRGGDPYLNGQVIDKSLFSVVMRIDVDQRGDGISHPIRRQPREVAELPLGTAASYTRDYYIPDDNPWVEEQVPGGPAESVYLEEIYVCGLRSPHSMQWDPVSGQVWIGDVGQDSREELDLFVIDSPSSVLPGQGLNFGWRVQEGTLGGSLSAGAPGVEARPVWDYPPSMGTCVISGGVYRGARFDERLGGKVLLGDNRSARIWTLEHEVGMPPVVEELTVLSDGGALAGGNVRGLTNFCRDRDGEVYMLYSAGANRSTGRVYSLEPGPASPEPPALLSETGAFTDLESLSPASFLLPYTVNSPLWSDRAVKSRWIAVPNDGVHDSEAEQISYRDGEPWEFPAGTVLVKHFELPVDDADPGKMVRLETRFIVCLPDGRQYGVTYRWRPDGSEADLLTEAGTSAHLVRGADGSTTLQTWVYPSRTDCMSCHNAASGQALGVRTPQLNGVYSYPDSQVRAHQIATWNSLTMFNVDLSASQIEGAVRSAGLDDRSMPLEHRVRSYLDSNCAHCHRPGGSGPGFDGRLALALGDQSLINEPLYPELEGRFDLVANSDADGQVIPGETALSAVHFRLAHALPSVAAMPPLAKNLVDERAVAAMTTWIQGLSQAEFAPEAPVRVALGGPLGVVDGLFVVTVVFDEVVHDFDVEDLSVVNGSVVGVSGEGYFYVVKILPAGPLVTVDLPAGVIDGGGRGNEASNQLRVSYEIPLAVDHDPETGVVTLSWPSQSNLRYNLRSSKDLIGAPSTWPIFGGHESLAPTEPTNTLSLVGSSTAARYFVIEGFTP